MDYILLGASIFLALMLRDVIKSIIDGITSYILLKRAQNAFRSSQDTLDNYLKKLKAYDDEDENFNSSLH